MSEDKAMFFILWGWGKQTRTEYGPVMPMTCSHCNNDVYWNLTRIREWFTIFFLPIIPYKSEHHLLCPICSWGVELHGSEIERAKQLAGHTTEYSGDRISDDAHQQSLSSALKTDISDTDDRKPRIRVIE